MEELRRSVRIGTLAEAWDCDRTHIRRLINTGELQARYVGKRGIRVFIDSALDYQESHSVPRKMFVSSTRALAASRPSQMTRAERREHEAAMAVLKHHGID